MISRSDWEPLPTPTLSPFCTRVPFSVSVFTAAVWCVPALRVPLVHSLINHFRKKPYPAVGRALHDPLRRPVPPLFVVSCLCAAGFSLPQCGVCPASSVGSGTVGLFIINYYCQKN